jgi:hypothetical protein
MYKFYPEQGVLDFVSRCSGSSNSWYQRITFPDWKLLVVGEEEEPPNYSPDLSGWQQIQQDHPDILGMDVKVGCGCPAFLYWGSAYIVDQLDSGDGTIPRYKDAPAPESRFPAVRDPGLEKTLCKHLAAVLRSFF